MSLNPSNRSLIQRCIKGDKYAQFDLYQQYSKAMFNICLRMLSSTDEAEDVLQISFVDVFRSLESYRHEATLGSWIKRIVINNCLTMIKKRRLHFESIEENHIQIPDEGPEPMIDSIDDLSVAKVKDAMARLPEGYRTVFTLYLFEGYDHQEIGQILDITEATSKSQFSRAKRKMRELLQQEVA